MLACFYPLIIKIPGTGGYTVLVYAYVIMSIFRNLCSQFVRAKQLTRLYAIDGVINTVLYLTFIVLFLGVFKWGVTGYVLATAAADFISAVFLFLTAGLHRYLKKSAFDKRVFFEMLKYATPLIPASMFWWITNTSDHIFITYMLGRDVNGLYETAYRVPNIIMLFSTLFTEAWQLSAITDGGDASPARTSFFSRVFGSYQALLFIGAAILIYSSKIIIIALTASLDSPYYPAWQFIPVLTIAMVFSCFASFLGSIYMVEKRSGKNLLTMAVGAVLNLILNFYLIPVFGANGAAFSTFASYFIVFTIRALSTRRYMRMNLHLSEIAVNLLLIVTETYFVLMQPPYWAILAALPALAAIVINLKPLLQSFRQYLVHQSAKNLKE